MHSPHPNVACFAYRGDAEAFLRLLRYNPSCQLVGPIAFEGGQFVVRFWRADQVQLPLWRGHAGR